MQTQNQTNQSDNLDNQDNIDNTPKKDYNQKWSAKAYKFFSLITFVVYYLNLSIRIIVRTFDYYEKHGVNNILDWFKLVFDFSNWGAMLKEIFDWYTIVLTIFLILYAIMFFIVFARFSPKKKKTFKYFKKGFLMARRFIKIINLALTLTVLINTAHLTSSKIAGFGDKFTLMVSLCSLLFTLLQIAISIITFMFKKKIKDKYRNVKAYVGHMGNTVSKYMGKPTQDISENAVVGKKMGAFKSQFLRTVEALAVNDLEAEQTFSDMQRDYERFENDYEQAVVDQDDAIQNQPQVEINFVADKQKKKDKKKKRGKKARIKDIVSVEIEDSQNIENSEGISIEVQNAVDNDNKTDKKSSSFNIKDKLDSLKVNIKVNPKKLFEKIKNNKSKKQGKKSIEDTHTQDGEQQ